MQGESTRLWDEPYLETCCRAALHRLHLASGTGRPGGLKDGPCLERLQGLGFSAVRSDGRFTITEAGRARHASEVLGNKVAIADAAGAPDWTHRD